MDPQASYTNASGSCTLLPAHVRSRAGCALIHVSPPTRHSHLASQTHSACVAGLAVCVHVVLQAVGAVNVDFGAAASSARPGRTHLAQSIAASRLPIT